MLSIKEINTYASLLADEIDIYEAKEKEVSDALNKILEKYTNVEFNILIEYFLQESISREQLDVALTTFQIGAYLATVKCSQNNTWQGGPTDTELEEREKEKEEAI